MFPGSAYDLLFLCVVVVSTHHIPWSVGVIGLWAQGPMYPVNLQRGRRGFQDFVKDGRDNSPQVFSTRGLREAAEPLVVLAAPVLNVLQV